MKSSKEEDLYVEKKQEDSVSNYISGLMVKIEDERYDIKGLEFFMSVRSKKISKMLALRDFLVTDIKQYYELLDSGEYVKKPFNFGSSYSKKRKDRNPEEERFLFYINESVKIKKDGSNVSVGVYFKFYLVENIMSILDFRLETDSSEEKIEVFKKLNELNRQTSETIQEPIKEDGKTVGYENVKNYIKIFVYNLREDDEDILVKCRDLEYIQDYAPYNLLNNMVYKLQ
jgi:hypothetical protein